MAIPTDPNFGASFDAAAEAAFRSAIISTMQMAAPNAISERATFQWDSVVVATHPNSSGRPFDFNAAPASTTEIDDVQVDCAVEFIDRAPDGTAAGVFENAKAKITLFDNEYEQVKTAKRVLLGGNTYIINFVEPPVALFPVTVYTMHCTAWDES